MTRRSRRSRPTLARFFRLSAWNIALALVAGLGLLFYQAVQSHRVEALEEQAIQLEAELEHAQQELVRATAAWHRASARDRVVDRATAELGMVEPDGSPREMVALARPTAKAPARGLPAVLDGLAQGLDRFGQIREAAAEEARAADRNPVEGHRP